MVQYVGKITRAQVNDLYGKSRAGIVLYQPAENHYESQPIKMFEYMAAGLPFVASDFPHWKSIVEKNKCGICVDPSNAEAVREACLYLLNNPSEAQEMGRRGHEAIMSQYNWKNEERKLLGLYDELLK